ncbi:unnamed protein product [Pleuronectes platessa]|uniref:Uncharacterized protein n=1 Tax=Pleuronectes platessa TaxID=8262 RepID=A0A9N7ZAN0_PLEPL|nr:unnamed protein product [Pleuronectes platessa]
MSAHPPAQKMQRSCASSRRTREDAPTRTPERSRSVPAAATNYGDLLQAEGRGAEGRGGGVVVGWEGHEQHFTLSAPHFLHTTSSFHCATRFTGHQGPEPAATWKCEKYCELPLLQIFNPCENSHKCRPGGEGSVFPSVWCNIKEPLANLNTSQGPRLSLVPDTLTGQLHD